MIYTVTLNPTLDRTMRFSKVVVGELNRAISSRTDLSGKGVNVSVALRQFGVETVMMGFAAGVFGRILVEGLRAQGYTCDFVEVEGETRSNYTVIDEAGGVTTKLNEPGPRVTEGDLAAFESHLQERVGEGDICVFSGSLPPGAPPNTCARLITAVQSRGAMTVLDTSGPALKAGCAACPELLKPNEVEATELVGMSAAGDEEVEDPCEMVRVVEAIRALGPRRVLLSLGSRGAVFADGDSIWWAEPPQITEVNAVGAGDASLAGALWAWKQGMLPGKVVRWAVASGTAAALENGSVAPAKSRIERVYAKVSTMCLRGECTVRDVELRPG